VTGPESDSHPLPLLDPSVLEMLRADLEDDGVWAIFIRNFIDNLPHRVERLRLSLTTGDLPGAVDAVLSLKTSSQMVGAERLAGLALDLEHSIRANTRGAEPAVAVPLLAASHLLPIVLRSRQTIHVLQVHQQQQPEDIDTPPAEGPADSSEPPTPVPSTIGEEERPPQAGPDHE
jgi:histidine phosphotransfer protein HptB